MESSIVPTTQQIIDGLIEMRDQTGSVPEEYFWQLSERFRADLVHQAFTMLRSQADAEDVAQDSLCEAFESINKLRDPQKLGNWLRQINRRNALDTIRRKQSAKERRLNTGELDDLRPQSGARKGQGMRAPGQRVEGDQVLDAVESLPAIFREVVILRYMEGLSCVEIASRMNIPEGTVRSRLCRADGMLIRKLGVIDEKVAGATDPKDVPKETAS